MLLIRESPLSQLAASEVTAALNHSDRGMRSTAILSVRFVGATGPETVQKLRELAESDPDAMVRAAARSTIRRLQAK